jgi:glycosyltransferase involved in cell wall biosynthesis
MLITVAICTWNRARLLTQALEQMRKLVIPAGVEWELLVVNNNCTDRTDEVIEKYRSLLPVRRLLEKEPGKSYALNRAIGEAQGEYILWTDDDVMVDANWIKSYCEAFLKWRDAVFFGGTILPLFEGDPPDWLLRVLPQLDGIYATRDFGKTSFEFGPEEFNRGIMPYGANFAVKTDVQARYLYDPRLGRRDEIKNFILIRGEETEVIERLLSSGAKGRWVPEAKVNHYIPGERQTVEYLRAICYADGLTRGMRIIKDLSDNRPLFLKLRWLLGKISETIQVELKYSVKRIRFHKPEAWVEDLIAASYLEGCAEGLFRSITKPEGRFSVEEFGHV